MNYLNETYPDLIKAANDHQSEYLNAKPFPNISFRNFFNPEILENLLAEFPDLSKENSSLKQNTEIEKKFSSTGENSFGIKTKTFLHYLNSQPFLEFLQILTGIEEKLIGDPYYLGGGLHEIKRGGLLKVHADFNKHYTLKLDRRINVLIYLNKNWKEEYGGHFELWDKDLKNCEKKILPEFNRLAIFSTTDFSYHGHPNALNCPEHMSRKSMALYYYSNGRPVEEIDSKLGEHSTIFKPRADNPDDQKAFAGNATPGLKNLIKDFIPPIVLKIKNKAMSCVRNK
jgi:Rps23 Pro-64 3,4-dihydroxylase Tpa1-like proline 4-hydroxylase